MHNLRKISIHAPARGATFPSFFASIITNIISIHAPARGATTFILASHAPPIDFNPRTRTGCDYSTIFVPLIVAIFQSTHPHGVRPYRHLNLLVIGIISIHAPARGATTWTFDALVTAFISIHAPARGATLLNTMVLRFTDFNPRTRTGCDLVSRGEINTHPNYQ
jgi:hypothetical protein